MIYEHGKNLSKRLPARACAALVILVLASGFVHAGALSLPLGRGPAPGVPAARLARLRRGINTSHWFAQVFDPRGYLHEHFVAHTTGEDAALIARLGFDHVRLSVEPATLLDESTPATLRAAPAAELDRAIGMLLAHGLAVVVDVHPTSEFKRRLASDARFADAFLAFWGALAHRISRFSPDWVFLEILNEPEIADTAQWSALQGRLASAIRAAAPRHTIVATGGAWSSVDRLDELQPLPDRNIVYAFHFYEPHTFTHQGATWGSPEWPFLKGVPYPVGPDAAEGLTAATTDARARAALAAYASPGWDRDRVRGEIARAGRWAKRHEVPVVCNEFGVYREIAPPESRIAWLRDVREALEAEGIGWTMWDYAGGFGVVTKTDAGATPDAGVVTALGLRERANRPARHKAPPPRTGTAGRRRVR